MTKIRAALKAKVSPSAMILEEPDAYEWRPWIDYRLVEALQVLEEETCSQCGNPLWLCHSSSPNVDVEIGYDSCIVAEAVTKHNDKESKKKRSKNKGQVYGRIIPIREGVALPTREEYYKELSERIG